MVVESKPEERKTPTGTSATKWNLTVSANMERRSSAGLQDDETTGPPTASLRAPCSMLRACSASRRIVLILQKTRGERGPLRSTHMLLPAGRLRMLRDRV